MNNKFNKKKPAFDQPKKRRSHRSESTNSLPEDCYIVDGESSLEEYARFNPEMIKVVACSESLRDKLMKHYQLSSVEWIDHKEWGSRYDNRLAETAIGAMVKIVPLAESDLLDRIQKREKDVLVFLDHVQDPRNLGAIVRTCGFFGVSDVIVPKNRQVLLTGASVGTSQGGFAKCSLTVVTNIKRVIDKLKDEGYWIVGSDMGGEPLCEVSGVYEKVVLVFGSEGKGISEQVKKKCDRIVGVKGSDNGLESLNVSVSAGIVINGFKN